MKKLIALVLLAAVIVAAIVFVPRLVHTCDDCGELFVGTGYEPNVLQDLMTDEEQIICKDCAIEQHAISIALGQELDSFKRPLFD